MKTWCLLCEATVFENREPLRRAPSLKPLECSRIVQVIRRQLGALTRGQVEPIIFVNDSSVIPFNVQ